MAAHARFGAGMRGRRAHGAIRSGGPSARPRGLPPSGWGPHQRSEKPGHSTPFRDGVLVLTADASSFGDALTKPIAAMLNHYPATLALDPSTTVPAIIIVGSDPHSARTDLNRLRPGIGRDKPACKNQSYGDSRSSRSH